MTQEKLISAPLIKYVLLSAVRDKIVVSLLLIITLSLSISVFLGSSATLEKDQFVSVYSAGGIRVAAVIGLILFIVFYIRRSFESRDVDYLLSRPISRLSFVLSHAAAFILIALVFAGLSSLAVYPFASNIDGNALPLWSLSLAVEFIIMACAAMFFSMVIASAAASAIVTLAFYTLARLIGQLINIAVSVKLPSGETMDIAAHLMEAISLFIPRLDLMGQTSWLIYGADGFVGYGYVIFHGLIFSAFLITATVIDLLKREF